MKRDDSLTSFAAPARLSGRARNAIPCHVGNIAGALGFWGTWVSHLGGLSTDWRGGADNVCAPVTFYGAAAEFGGRREISGVLVATKVTTIGHGD